MDDHEHEHERRATLIEVLYPAHRGAIGLRGDHAPLSWEHTTPPHACEGDRHLFSLEIPEGELLELKLVRNQEDWAGGRNYTVHAGDHLRIEPYFDHAHARLLPPEELDAGGEKLSFRVLLPPSYDEQEHKRYPVLYVHDGQALWSTSSDPYGIWNLDQTIDQLVELSAIEELIVVGIDTADRRLDRLSPVPDPEYGGGEGPRYLAALVDHLLPTINARYRTRTDRHNTALMGSSMGGLFSFYAAWTRRDVFGKAACLSSSFWWASRHMVRVVQSDPAAGATRPFLYIDSGAARSAFDDPRARDGFHHTRSMFRALIRHGYVAGVDLHRLAFPGHSHEAAAWAARVAIPLQLLFPRPLHSQVPLAALQREASAAAR